MSTEADALVPERTRQLEQHPRISVLLIPSVRMIDSEECIGFYWLDRHEDGAATTTVRVSDYVGEAPEDAAKKIVSGLFSK